MAYASFDASHSADVKSIVSCIPIAISSMHSCAAPRQLVHANITPALFAANVLP